MGARPVPKQVESRWNVKLQDSRLSSSDTTCTSENDCQVTLSHTALHDSSLKLNLEANV